MNWEAVRLLFDIAYAVVVGGCALYVFVTERKRVTEEKLADALGEIDKDISGHDARITRIEEDLRHNQSAHGHMHEDLGKLFDELRKVSGGVATLNGEMHAVREQVVLMNRHLMDKV